MRILQVNASYKPAYIYGGPTMSVSKLSEEMIKAGCDVEVYTTTANGAGELAVTPNETMDVDGVKVTYFKRLTKDHTHFSPALFRRLRTEVQNFDIVHIHAWWNLVSVFSCRIALKKGIPVVVSPRGTLSGYSFSNRNSFTKRLMHSLIGKSALEKSVIHVTSDREKTAMETLIGAQRIFNIPNFINLPNINSSATPEGDNMLRLIFLSRIEKKKGLEILFDALAKINVPYRLTIAGDGDATYIDTLKARAKENRLEEYINWIGFRGNDKFALLQQHHLLVLPSYDENFGNVVIESLGVGTAVLISNNVGLAGYVEQNNLGWVCDNDAGSFSKMISQISNEKTILAAIRAKAPAIIRREFNEETLRLQYLDMYHQIINNG